MVGQRESNKNLPGFSYPVCPNGTGLLLGRVRPCRFRPLRADHDSSLDAMNDRVRDRLQRPKCDLLTDAPKFVRVSRNSGLA